jgi:hypothetical protein
MFIQRFARAAILAVDYIFVRTAPWKLISGNHRLQMPESCADSE